MVGSGNSAADICQDLVFRGAASVTMLQRSTTCVVSNKVAARRFAESFPENLPLDIVDLRANGMPFNLRRYISKFLQPSVEEEDKDMLEGLRKAGFHLNNGKDGSGQSIMYYLTGGGK